MLATGLLAIVLAVPSQTPAPSRPATTAKRAAEGRDPAASPLPAAPRFQPAGTVELFARGIVSTESADVKVTFSPDGSRALWGTIGREGGKGGWEIFESRKEPSGWGTPRPASFSSAANDFDPFFAPDSSGVYFFSNREGGFGKDDLWFAPFDAKTGAYGEARNLGPGVNTAGDEWAPVLSPDGARLLFASDGLGGEGKHDLFLATRSKAGSWGAPRNLGKSVNSTEEDFDAAFLPDGRTIVFSSGDLEGEVRLHIVQDDGRGYGNRSPLSADINAPGTWTFGPSIAPAEPGVLYFTSKREGGAGRMDIHRVRYELK